MVKVNISVLEIIVFLMNAKLRYKIIVALISYVLQNLHKHSVQVY